MRVPYAICYHKRGTTDLSPEVRVKVRWHFNKNRLATMIRNYPLWLLLTALPGTILIYLGNMIWEMVALRNFPLAMTRLQAIGWVITNLSYLLTEREKIRKTATIKSDKRIFQLFAKADIWGKLKAVVMDKFTPKVAVAK